MKLTEFQVALMTTVVFFITTIAGIGYVTIPNDPPWPLYIYTIVTALTFLYWTIRTVKIASR